MVYFGLSAESGVLLARDIKPHVRVLCKTTVSAEVWTLFFTIVLHINVWQNKQN